MKARARRQVDKAEVGDALAQATYTEVFSSTAMGRRKNTKRWCGGKIGREHTPKCVDYKETKNYLAGFDAKVAKGWKLLICTRCGKELDRWMPMNWTRVGGTAIETRQPPDWAK